jgi:BASS family bile acid:Na+ symporter
MSLSDLIPLAIQGSIMLLVFALGLEARYRDATYLFRHPAQFAWSMIAMYGVMLVFAVAVIELFDIHRAVKIALVALALSPVPPILPTKQRKAGGETAYVVGLLVGASLVALVVVPLAMGLAGKVYDSAEVSVGTIAPTVLRSVLLPLAAGIAFNAFFPATAAKISRAVALSGTVILVLAALPLVIAMWPQLEAIVGNGTLAVLVLFTMVGVAAGHLLGGPDNADRTVLALATGARHPGMAVAIAHAAFPDEKAVMAVVVWHLVVGGIVALPYVRWRTRLHAGP